MLAGGSNMDATTAREISSRYVDGHAVTKLAKHYGISPNRVYSVIPPDPARDWLDTYIRQRINEGMVYARPIRLVEDAYDEGVIPSKTRRYVGYIIQSLKQQGFTRYGNRKQSVFHRGDAKKP